MSYHQDFAGFFAGLDHGGGVFKAGGHGFFAEYVFTGLEGGDAQACMLAVGCGNHHGVYVTVSDKLFFGGSNFHAVVLGQAPGSFADRIVYHD